MRQAWAQLFGLLELRPSPGRGFHVCGHQPNVLSHEARAEGRCDPGSLTGTEQGLAARCP